MGLLMELVKSSTIHGISHIYFASNKLSKCLWILLFLSGIGGITINIIFITLRYFSNPVLINYTLDYEPFLWPDLTFCNPASPFFLEDNIKNINYWNSIVNQSKELTATLKKTGVLQIINNRSKGLDEIYERTLSMATINPLKIDVDKFTKHILYIGYIKAHSGIYFSKEFEGNNPSIIDEDLDKLFTTQIVQIGNNIPCHTFHVDKSVDLNRQSIESLVFYLKFNHDSYKKFNSSYISRSVLLYINNKNELPKSEIILLPGFNNILEVSQSRYQFNGIKRPCRNEAYKVELYDALLLSTDIYEGSFEDCKKVISQHMFVNYCKCYNPFLPIYKDENLLPKLCLNASYFTELEIVKNSKCMVNVYNKFRSRIVFDEILKLHCDKFKPDKCDAVNYKIEQRKEMVIDLWSKSTNDRRFQELKMLYMQIFRKQFADEDFVYHIRDNIVKVSIKRTGAFGDLFKEEKEYPFSQLLSDIGGLMGLWLGMSVVGLFEIVEFICLSIIEVGRVFKRKSDKSILNTETDVFSI